MATNKKRLGLFATKKSRSVKNKPSSKRFRFGLLSTALIAAVGSYFLFFASAATPDGCTNSNMKVFMSGSCVQVIKNLANIAASTSANDTNNPGFDGTLNQTLLNLGGFGIFNGCDGNTPGYVPTAGVTPCVYNKLKDFVDAKLNPPPAPAPAPTPPDNSTPCRDQGLHTGSSGSCVTLLNAMMNNVIQKCYNKKPLLGGANFDNDTNSYLAWTTAAGNLGDEARNTGYANVVTQRLWDIVTYMNGYYSNGKACLGVNTTNATVQPKPTTTSSGSSSSTKPTSTTSGVQAVTIIPGVTAKAPDGTVIDCATARLALKSKNDCVKQLKYYLIGFGAQGLNAGDATFDQATEDALWHLLNETSTITGIDQGSYNHVVTDKIWFALKLNALKKQQNDAQAIANDIKAAKDAQRKADKAAAEEKRRQDLQAYAQKFADLAEGDPSYVQNFVPQTIRVSADFKQTDPAQVAIGTDDGAITQGMDGYCIILVYKSIDGKTNMWTYQSYDILKGVCRAKKSVANRADKTASYKWTTLGADQVKMRDGYITTKLPQPAQASSRAVNGSLALSEGGIY